MAGPTMAERIYQRVYDDLQAGRIGPGDVLREEHLAAEHGASRTPVREALGRLIQEGVFERRGAGVRVIRLTLERVHEIYPVVSVLEGLAARLCCEQIDDVGCDRLTSLHAEMQDARTEGEHGRYVALNQTFHETIQGFTGNPTLIGAIRPLRVLTMQLRTYSLGIGGRMTQSCEEHAVLIAAFRARDAPGAEATMRAHVDHGYGLLSEALRSVSLIEPWSPRDGELAPA